MEVKAEIIYQKIDNIGAGKGMNSEVWVVFDPQRNARVVAKEIHRPTAVVDPDELFKEAHAVCAATTKNVVPIYYACKTSEKICLVMPYYKNGSLGDLIKVDPVSVKDVIRFGQEILNGVGKIHASGHIHFDLKPSNVLLDDHGAAMIADFGQTRRIRKDGTVEMPPMYSDALPPEFFKGGAATSQSDIYHIGLTLYRAANGDSLFDPQRPATEDALTSKTLAGTFPDRQLFLPHVPNRIRTIIRKALQTDPAKRYTSASDMAQSLANVVVKNDWQARNTLNGMEWFARRPKKPSIIVLRIETGGKHDVQSYTESASGRRSRKKSEWREGLSLNAANEHLTDLFHELERE